MQNLKDSVLKNQYFLREFVGSGGMADVYLAWDKLRSSKMAVKILHRDLAENRKFLQALDNEARSLKKLGHPYIVRLFEYGSEKDIVYIVMAWIDGIDLKKRILSLKRSFSPAEAGKILEPICSALNFAHQKGIYHCGIKPANILLHENGRDVFLADFGIACVAQEQGNGGTLPYMAPEQFSREKMNAQTDIYALGITLYEILSGGILPFRGETSSPGTTTRAHFAYEHNYVPLPSIIHFNPNLSPSIISVLQKALNKNPSDRFRSTLDFYNAFVQAQNDEFKLESLQANNSNWTEEEKTMSEAYCPEHGPYDASLGACPYPHLQGVPRPGMPTPLEDDLPTDFSASRRAGRGILDFDEEEATELPLNEKTMHQEAYCPEHGPYDASLGACPYPHASTRRSEFPNPPEDDLPTGLGVMYNSGTAPTLPPYIRRRGILDYEDEAPKKFRTEGKSYNLRIFVSSTFEDLKEYREAVFKAIHSMLGYTDDMLFWSADERDALTVSLDRVRQCDLVILLIAHRYGYVPAGQKYSITELEYRTAKQANIPVLAFFVDEKLPWPKSDIEIDKQEDLAKFKTLVEADVVRKIFSSTHELHALVTEALHHFIERHRKSLEGRQFRRTHLVKAHTELATIPDIAVQIGESEDELPLLLNIKRSKDLGIHIDRLAEMIESDIYDDSIDDMLDGFRDQLERRAARNWASNRIFSVRLQNGAFEELYVTRKNLSELTTSLLFNILESSKYLPQPRQGTAPRPVVSQPSGYSDEDDITQLPAPRSSGSDSEDNPRIQSVGGSNRFLGISTTSEQTYSVGIDSGDWVEWHPFYQESIRQNFPDCRFYIHPFSTEEIVFNSFKDILEEYFFDHMDERGVLDGNIRLILSRQSIGQTIAKIANTVASIHAKGKIHGDLKPKNILLTRTGPFLIDSLDLNPGNLSHGWTPNWSAPEQVLQIPITYATDIYPLGLLVLNAIGGKLLGEVRKFIVPTLNDPEKEHNVFYNPSIFLDESEVIKNGKKEWISFVESCLKFDSGLRIKSASDFYGKLSDLLEKFPLNGNVSVNLSNGSLIAATLLDGSKRIAKMISDES
jgi:serine/threonine protein kinase